MHRTSVNPTDWGLAFEMDQGEITQGATRHLRCSGQVDLVADEASPIGVSVAHPGDIAGQIKSALANVDALLEQAGMARRDIVYVRMYTTDVDAMLENYGLYGEWIAAAGIRPPQSLLGVARLALPELLVEFEVEAQA